MSFGGIAFPELVLRDIAETAIRNLAGEQGVLDLMLAGLATRDRDSVRSAFARRPIQARIGYALENPEDAQVTVIMASTTPRELLGQTLGRVEAVPVFSSTLTADVSREVGVTLAVEDELPETGLPPTGRIILDDEVATYHLVDGALVLQARGLQGTEALWHYTGEPVRCEVLTQRVGWGETCDMRVDVLSSNPVMNLVLATAIKAALLLQAATCETYGLTLGAIRETDMAPRPTLWPAELLNRTLLLTVQRDFGLPEVMKVLTRVDQVVTLEGGA